MTIPVASNAKRQLILAGATSFFADQGYDRASMSKLALECGVSKGLLYHYFTSKDELLTAILDAHLRRLSDAVLSVQEPSAEKQLLVMMTTLLDLYEGADQEHRLQLNALRFLPVSSQVALKDMQRQIVQAFSQSIIALQPNGLVMPKTEIRALTMSLFGMLNWHYLWNHQGKDIDKQSFAQLCLKMVKGGMSDGGHGK